MRASVCDSDKDDERQRQRTGGKEMTGARAGNLTASFYNSSNVNHGGSFPFDSSV